MQTVDKFAGDIIKHLERLEHASGTRAGTVFNDFLTASLLTLERLPDHLESATTTGHLAEPTPDEAEVFQEMHERYSHIRDIDFLDYFAPAFNVLLESTSYGYMDVLGVVYMQYGYPGEGQVFTPYHVAEMMAQMVIDPDDLHARVQDAIAQSPVAKTALMLGTAIEDPDEAKAWFLERVIPPALQHYEPISVCDPCVGSGTMLLAAASVFPQWAVHRGLIEFYGQDIDPTCVTMAKINAKLYGLGGERVRYALAMSDAELEALPEPWDAMYAEAKTAKDNGNDGRVLEIEQAMRAGEQALFEQMEMF
jgi:type I restriction-modification system DNA methylase subunit